MKKVTIRGKCLNIAASVKRSAIVKANEFVKKFGIEKAKQAVGFGNKYAENGVLRLETFDGDEIDVAIDDLKHLVESHELVEAEGGLLNVKNSFQMERDCGGIDMTPFGKKLYQAIADVESCQ